MIYKYYHLCTHQVRMELVKGKYQHQHLLFMIVSCWHSILNRRSYPCVEPKQLSLLYHLHHTLAQMGAPSLEPLEWLLPLTFALRSQNPANMKH